MGKPRAKIKTGFKKSLQRRELKARQLLKETLVFLKSHWRWLSSFVGVALAINLALTYLVGDPAYLTVWFVFFGSSLIWSIRHFYVPRAQEAPTLGMAYWQGSAAALKLVVVLSVIAIASTPFSVGAFLYGTVNYLALGSLWADFIAAAVWMSLGTISLLLLARLMPALPIVTLPELTPLRALKTSWRLSKGATLAVAKCLLLLFGVILLFLTLSSLGLSLLPLSGVWLQLGLSTLTFGLVMPFFLTYVFILYKKLS